MICACALGQAYGDSGLERWVDRAADLAEAFARKAEGSKGHFQLAQPLSPFNVCFWWVPHQLRPYKPDKATAAEKALLSKVETILPLHCILFCIASSIMHFQLAQPFHPTGSASGGCYITCSPTDRIRHLLLSMVILSHLLNLSYFSLCNRLPCGYGFLQSNACLPSGTFTTTSEQPSRHLQGSTTASDTQQAVSSAF